MSRTSVACARYLLFAFTLAFVIFGVLMCYSATSTFIRFNRYDLVILNSPDNSTIALLVIGFAIFFTAFMGCCGALTGNDFMLRTFSFTICLLLIIEIFSVGFVYTFRKSVTFLYKFFWFIHSFFRFTKHWRKELTRPSSSTTKLTTNLR